MNELMELESAVSAGELTPAARDNIRRWLIEPGYHREAPAVKALIDAERWNDLQRWFWEVLPFGTGGRRGLMADLGSATLNPRTVGESAMGMARYVKQTKPAGPWRVVIACDTRHRSTEFARIAAGIFAAEGFATFLFDGHRSTPELSFAVRYLQCDAGVMISASHNPPSDNGIKAYWSHGGQVLPPHDQGIIDAVAKVGELPEVDFAATVKTGGIQMIGQEIDDAYLDAVLSLSLSPARELTVLYSPLHGVGETSVAATLQRAGFNGLHLYEPQRQPDGDFPNVPDRLPNPERPAVFPPMVPRAKNLNADLIIASDPDADRLGAMIRTAAGEYVYATGNQLGALLIDYVSHQRQAQGTITPDHYILTTLVTTPLVGAVARQGGLRVIEDLLVGFKHIGARMDAEGPEKFVYACEESHGFLGGTHCRDKDASIAALWLCEAAAEDKCHGRTLLDRLDDLSVLHGYHVERQAALTLEGADGQAAITSLMTRLRTAPPTNLAGFQFVEVRDYSQHEIRTLPDNQRSADLLEPSGNLLIFQTRRGDASVKLAVRPSGTEPKIKFYAFGKTAPMERSQLATTRVTADADIDAFVQAWMGWIKTVLAPGQ
ncbi:MAG: phospho-sugar mutase [Planctomycetaceae bacterium]|nr:phospho-sugar mutase [Planctomycetaceae bacterium]